MGVIEPMGHIHPLATACSYHADGSEWMCPWISWLSWFWGRPCLNLHFMLSYISIISWIWYMCFHGLVPKVGFWSGLWCKMWKKTMRWLHNCFLLLLFFHGLFLLVFMTIIKSIWTIHSLATPVGWRQRMDGQMGSMAALMFCSYLFVVSNLLLFWTCLLHVQPPVMSTYMNCSTKSRA